MKTALFIGDKANSVVFDNSKVKRAVPDFDAWCDMVIAKMDSLIYG